VHYEILKSLIQNVSIKGWNLIVCSDMLSEHACARLLSKLKQSRTRRVMRQIARKREKSK